MSVHYWNLTHAKAVGRKLGGDFSADQVLLARNTVGHMLARSRLVYAVATVIASIFLLICFSRGIRGASPLTSP